MKSLPFLWHVRILRWADYICPGYGSLYKSSIVLLWENRVPFKCESSINLGIEWDITGLYSNELCSGWMYPLEIPGFQAHWLMFQLAVPDVRLLDMTDGILEVLNFSLSIWGKRVSLYTSEIANCLYCSKHVPLATRSAKNTSTVRLPGRTEEQLIVYWIMQCYWSYLSHCHVLHHYITSPTHPYPRLDCTRCCWKRC